MAVKHYIDHCGCACGERPNPSYWGITYGIIKPYLGFQLSIPPQWVAFDWDEGTLALCGEFADGLCVPFWSLQSFESANGCSKPVYLSMRKTIDWEMFLPYSDTDQDYFEMDISRWTSRTLLDNTVYGTKGIGLAGIHEKNEILINTPSHCKWKYWTKDDLISPSMMTCMTVDIELSDPYYAWQFLADARALYDHFNLSDIEDEYDKNGTLATLGWYTEGGQMVFEYFDETALVTHGWGGTWYEDPRAWISLVMAGAVPVTQYDTTEVIANMITGQKVIYFTHDWPANYHKTRDLAWYCQLGLPTTCTNELRNGRTRIGLQIENGTMGTAQLEIGDCPP